MTVLKGEGTHSIIYGTAGLYAGLRRNIGYIARTDHAGAFPTIILAHDVWGITSYVKDLARKVARHGFNVVVPDLYEGEPVARGSDWETASGWFARRAALKEPIDIAYQFILSDDTPWVRPGVTGALGLGHGSPAIGHLANLTDLGAVVVVAAAGRPVPGGVPTMALHGKSDEVVPLPQRESTVEWVLYEGVKHDFLNDHGPDYAEGAATDAIERITAFFVRTLL